MEIINESSIQLPDDVVKAVEAARNNVTLMEQETRRLKGLAIDQEAIIRGLLDRQASLQDGVDVLEKKRGDIESQVLMLRKNIDEHQEELKNVQIQLHESQDLLKKVNEVKQKVSDMLASL